MSKIFKIKADAEFEAENIDDAFLKLSSHFINMAHSGLEDDGLFIGGEISISPIVENDNQ